MNIFIACYGLVLLGFKCVLVVIILIFPVYNIGSYLEQKHAAPAVKYISLYRILPRGTGN